MNLVFPEIDCVFDTESEKINTLIIENPPLLCSFLTDLQNQFIGNNGKTVLSKNNKILPIEKKLEIIDKFIPFDINSKALISKISSDIEVKAVSEEFYANTNELLGNIDSYFSSLSFDYPCDIQFTKINIGSFIKASGIEICDDYDNLGEKIIDYIQLVTEFIGEKLFIIVNLRSYISDQDAELFMKTCLSHRFDILMIETFEHPKFDLEKRIIIDADFCLIG